MSKKSLLDKMNVAIDIAENKEVDFHQTVLATPDQLKNLKSEEEKKTKKIHTYLKPADYDEFISYLGRKSESSAIRNLILEFNQKNRNSKNVKT